jgi:magnesium-transporting ATPase (P-type)
MKHSYYGLTALQVAGNRNYFGANTLVPSPMVSDDLITTQQLMTSWFVRGVLIATAVLLFLIPLLDLVTGNIPYELWIVLMTFIVVLTLVALLVLMIVGIRWIIQRIKHRHSERIDAVRDKVLVRVVRDGVAIQVPRMDIVVGDVILLGVGDEVPADAILLESSDLIVSEYIVNGKFEASKKSKEMDADTYEVGEPNYVVSGSIVLQGEAVAQVFALGNRRLSSSYSSFKIPL